MIKDGWAETALVAVPAIAFTYFLFNVLLAL